jgi:acylphosphatase
MNKRARIFFFGTVQGVGFRYTAANVARRHRVTGWVRNRSDGRVEVLVEGSAKDVESFILDVEDEMSGYITKKVITWESASGEWNGFSITPTE